jgi:CheY-like chemotaxis protein
MNVLFVDEDYEPFLTVKALQARHPSDLFKCVSSIQLALKELETCDYDLLVLDIMLPSDERLIPGSSEKSGLYAGLVLGAAIESEKVIMKKKPKLLYLTALDVNLHSPLIELRNKIGNKLICKPIHPDSLYEILIENIN